MSDKNAMKAENLCSKATEMGLLADWEWGAGGVPYFKFATASGDDLASDVIGLREARLFLAGYRAGLGAPRPCVG